MSTFFAVSAIIILLLLIIILCGVFAMTVIAFMHAMEDQASVIDDVNTHLADIKKLLKEKL